MKAITVFQNETKLMSLLCLALTSLSVAACSPATSDSVAAPSNKSNNVLGGGSAPLTGDNNTSTTSCAASSTVTWAIQDISYSKDFYDSPQKPSVICKGSVASSNIGATVEISSNNGSAGKLSLTCQAGTGGVGQWVANQSVDGNGAPTGSSCGIYNSSYRPAKLSKVKFLRAASLSADAGARIYGMSAVTRNYHPTYKDHLFNLETGDRVKAGTAEGLSGGFVFDGIGINVVHVVDGQNNGQGAQVVAPDGLKQIFRCRKPSNRHYVGDGSCGTDTSEGALGYLFTSSSSNAVSLEGVTLIGVYRCQGGDFDLATPNVDECTAISATSVQLLGYMPAL